MELIPVDRVEVVVLVDNVTDSLSSTPGNVETEFARLARRGGHLVAGETLCSAAHGLSLLISVASEGRETALLFDAGPEGELLARNVQRLGVDLAAVEAVVLSHGHWDHGGGMLRALDLINAAGGPSDLPYLAHPDMFHQRAQRRPDGTFQPRADVPSPRAIELHGGDPVVTTEPHALLDGRAAISGEIPRITDFERGLPGQHRRADPASDWEPDELVLDERFVALQVRGKGLIVLSACSHAGIVNVLNHATTLFPEIPIYAIVGGLHLAGANERIIPATVTGIQGFAPQIVAAGHCTGWRAHAALAETLGDERTVPLAVGATLTF